MMNPALMRPRPDRRRSRVNWPAVATAVAGGSVLLVGLTYLYARTIGRRWLHVSTYEVTVPGLPPAWEGVRIAQMTDIHLGARGAPYGTIRRAIGKVVAARPDLITLTGDYVDDGNPQRSVALLAPLAKVAPTMAVLGNHDYRRTRRAGTRIADHLEALGIHVLRNDALPVVLRGVAGLVAGFDDTLRGPGADIGEVLVELQGERPVLCLIHEPDLIDRLPPDWAGLTLAGHTHGAQVALSPWRRFEWVRFVRDSRHTRYPRGWFTVRGNQLYVNRGLGVSGRPLRFGVRPELGFFTLHTPVAATSSDQPSDPEEAAT